MAYPPPCTEAIDHGPADGAGKCPWCRVKYMAKAEFQLIRPALTELSYYYGMTYDPDFPYTYEPSDRAAPSYNITTRHTRDNVRDKPDDEFIRTPSWENAA